MVGFNRRFAPLVQKIREFFSQVNEPKFILYRVNAGFIAREHWLQQATIGGGRLVGEACHFVDLICYLIGQPVGGIDAQMMNDVGRYAGDNFVISLRFTDGSLGNLIYVANGNSQLPKEYIEMHSGGCTGVLDDFTRLSLHSGQKTQVIKSKRDKGHSAEIAAWLDCLRHGTREPNPFVESVATMRAVFAAQTILALPTLM
jgi:polar amino acid transport system substrate-binding protein